MERLRLLPFFLTQGPKHAVKVFDFDFATIEIKGRAGSGGNISNGDTRYVKSS